VPAAPVPVLAATAPARGTTSPAFDARELPEPVIEEDAAPAAPDASVMSAPEAPVDTGVPVARLPEAPVDTEVPVARLPEAPVDTEVPAA
jgi:hypothetical protein